MLKAQRPGPAAPVRMKHHAITGQMPGAHSVALAGWRDDPGCQERVPNGFGGENCVLHV
jgi:hypothetical protein